jgi:uncharacterized membrane protein
MSSTDELLREIEDDTSQAGQDTQPEQETESRRSRIANNVQQVFSPRRFLVSLVLISVGLYAAGSLIPIIPATGLIGVFVATFALGVINSEQWYVEIGVASAVASGVSVLSDILLLTIASRFGIGLVVAGVAVSVVVALLGHYFGRDLRGGMTKEIE